MLQQKSHVSFYFGGVHRTQHGFKIKVLFICGTQALRFKFRSPVLLLPFSISLFQNKIHFPQLFFVSHKRVFGIHDIGVCLFSLGQKSFLISTLHTGLPKGRHHLMVFGWQICCSRTNFDLGAHFIAIFSNNRIIVIVCGESTAYRKTCKVLQGKGEVFVFVCLKAKSFMGQGVTQK